MSSAPLPPRGVIEARAARIVRAGKTLLRDVDIHAAAGEVLGVLGPSGAGKSTFFRALVGDIRLDGGEVRLLGSDVSAMPLWKRARAGIGYMPQSPSVLWELSVRANLEAFSRIRSSVPHVPGPADPLALAERAAPGKRLAELAAERVDLVGRLDVRAGDLSAGERRRLEFARATTHTPHVLVCDEPFAGVDPAGARRLADLLVELAGRGVAVLLADHHVDEALRICSRAILLLDGSVAVNGTPDEFRRDPLVEGRYLGSWSRSLPPPT